MASAKQVIAVAVAEIGYKEKETNNQLDDKVANAGDENYTKYARDFDQKWPNWYNGKKNGFAWCDVFVDWCFLSAFGYEKALSLLCQPEKSCGAGCTFSAGYYKAKGQFHTSGPKCGDQIFFGTSISDCGHTGLVESADAARVYTIEGNSSDQVVRRSYLLTDKTIVGYGRPAYDSDTNESPAPQASTKLNGIDVSKWQGEIDWKKVKAAGVKFAMIRLGYGSKDGTECGTDGYFEKNVSGAVAAGIEIGCYFYSYALSTEAAKKEAEYVVSVLKKYNGVFTYPIAFDIEDPSQSGLGKATLTDMVIAFGDTIEKAGYYCSVYANLNWFKNVLDDSKLARFDHWLAQWASAPTYTGTFGIWQSSSTGKVDGISGNVDTDVAYLDYPTTIKSKKLNGFKDANQKPTAPSASGETPNTPSIPASGTIEKGDLVSIASNAVYYSGAAIPDWVKSQRWYVLEVSGDRAVIDKSESGKNNICSPINIKYLSAATGTPAAPWVPAIGDRVIFKDGNRHYSSANASSGYAVKGGLAKITAIYQPGKSKHPYHLRAIDSQGNYVGGVYGWCDQGTFSKA